MNFLNWWSVAPASDFVATGLGLGAVRLRTRWVQAANHHH
jgi:hypothetical protein